MLFMGVNRLFLTCVNTLLRNCATFSGWSNFFSSKCVSSSPAFPHHVSTSRDSESLSISLKGDLSQSFLFTWK